MYQESLLTPRPAWMPDALMVLARHRFATARQLAARLALDVTEVTATCTALVAEGALRELRQSTFVARDGAAPAYALTPIGLSQVAVDPATCRPRATRTLRSAFSLAHELAVNEFALALEVLDARGDLRLLSWTTARESLADVAFLAERGRVVRVPLFADALAVVEVQGARYGLLIEIDMGTVSATTMQKKYAGYHAWWLAGGPARRFGLPATRVVTVAPALRRLARLRSLAVDANAGRGSGLLWFLAHDMVDVTAPERLMDGCATVGKPNDEELRPLFRP